MKPSFEKLLPPEGGSIRCFNRAAMEQPVNWHYHPEFELTLVERGTGTRFVGDNIDTYCDGDLVFLGSNLPHHWSSDEFRGRKYDRHPAVVVQFPRELFGPMLKTPEMAHIRELLVNSERGLHVRGKSREIVAESMIEMLQLAAFDRLMRLLQCLQILATSDHVVPLASEGYSPSYCRKSQERLHRVLEYISEHLTDPGLSQAEVARYAEITPAAFCRFFRKATERTVVDFINEQRIAMAARMLVETDLSILNICLNAGFENPSNFNRRFRQFKGMSPRAYRAEFLNLAEPKVPVEQ